MTTTSGTPIPYLDLLDPALRPDGPEVAAARARSWYARTPFGVAVLRHEPLSRLLADRRLRQGSHRVLAVQGITEGPLAEWMNSMILSLEGPDHLRIRRLVSRAFTPASVTALRPRMRRIAHDLVDGFVADGRAEFMAAFADPYPAAVICELLGVPPALRSVVHGWANDLGLAFSFTAAANLARIEAALAGLYAATDTLIVARRADPGPDLLSALIAARDHDDRLTDTELRLLVTALLFAGQDTTHHQLGLAVALFLDHPEQWALLAANPDLAPAAVDEALRLAPTTPLTGRVAVEDFSYDGLTLEAGTLVHMMLAAGNSDPAVHGPDAPRFDITADRPPPLTFGAGPHFCLGAILARVEMAEALTVLATRLGPIRLDGPADWRPALGIVGPTRLPVAFDRAAR
jgi:cytochrome P450